MNLNDYRINAYNKVKGVEDKKDSEEVQSVSRQIRRNAEGGHEPLIHKPIFEKVNSQVNEILNNQKLEKENLEQAKLAARTGSWYGKKTSPTDEDVRAAAAPLTSGGLIKVPEKKKDGQKESLYRRVAKFLVIIGVDEAAKIIPHLTEEQTEKIIPEIASIRSVSPEEAQEVLAEFSALLDKAQEEGGVDTARTILTKAYGAKKADDLIARSIQYPEGKPFDFLADADSERIRLLLSGESAQIQALVLSQLEPKKAAGVINIMEYSQKKDVVLRLAKMQSVAPEVIKEIGKSLHQKLLTQNTENSQDMDGRGVLAQILKRMDPVAESSIINTLSEENPDLGADLRKRLFTEEDVVNCDDRYMQEKLRFISDRDIAILLKGKNSDFRGKIFKNVSKTRGDTILEEEKLLQRVLKSDVERMTSQFYAELRRAWESGELRIAGRDDDEVYV